MNVYKIARRLIGSIKPVGETNGDNVRYSNLLDHIGVASKMIYDLCDVAKEKDRVEYSRKRAGEKAVENLKYLLEVIQEVVR